MKHISCKIFSAGLILSFLLFSCKGEDKVAPDRITDISYTPEPTTALHDYFYTLAEADSGTVAPDSGTVRTFLRTVSDAPYSDALVDAWAHSAVVGAFTPEVKKVFPIDDQVRENIGYTLAAAKAYGVDLPARKYVTVVYGRPESILFTETASGDSLMFIALNHYLGADFEGYSHWPAYVRSGKTPQRMPYDIAEALVAVEYPRQQAADVSDNTLLSRMIYEGALAEARMRLVENASEAEALGYTDAELEFLEKNEKEIWQKMVASKLLYETSPTLIDRLIAPAPSTASLLLPETPGRAGRYIGYKIVRAYLSAHPETKLPEMLSPAFYGSPQEVLMQSKY